MIHTVKYFWQDPSWPIFSWQSAAILKALGDCRYNQGSLLTQLRELGFDIRQHARAEVLIEEAIKTSEIEGERLDANAVRSSVARRLGLPSAGLPTIINQQADGMVDILLDATLNYQKELTAERLFGWHAALFPTGYSGLHKIRVACWRDDRQGPMRVVSGPIGREKIHYEAPPAHRLEVEVDNFFGWWERSRNDMDGILRAALAHLWFVLLHPFDDGNGRIARALTEMSLAQDEDLSNRFYSLSSQVMAERTDYYKVLNLTSRGTGDVTGWLKWFLGCMSRSLLGSHELLSNVMQKKRFWQRFAQGGLNDRQSKAVNRLLDVGPGSFEGGMTNRKYAGLNHTSRATAQRELADLMAKGILRRNPGGGRSISYDLNWERLEEDVD